MTSQLSHAPCEVPRKPGTLTAFWYAGPGVHFVSPGLLQLTVFAKGLMSRLQSLQNAAARLVSDARRYDRITPVLQKLHWLPVRRRVDFKMATLVYLSLSSMAPPYLSVGL